MLAAVETAPDSTSSGETGGVETASNQPPHRSVRRPVSPMETERRRAQMKEQGDIVAERFRQLRQGRS